MVAPFIPWLIGAAGVGASHVITKSNEEKKSEEKLDLVKKLADLTPEQAQAVDAVKKQTVEEMQTRVTLGVGPFAPLPEQASERAKEVHAAIQEARERGVPPSQVIAEKLSKITEDEKEKIMKEPPEQRQAAIDRLSREKSEIAAHAIYELQTRG